MVTLSTHSPVVGSGLAPRTAPTPRSARLRRRRVSRTLKGWAFLVPTIIFIAMFCYWPAGTGDGRGVHLLSGVSAPTFVGLKKLDQLLHDSIFGGVRPFVLVVDIRHPRWDCRQSAGGTAHLSFAQCSGTVLVPGAFTLTLCLPGIVGILTWGVFFESGGVIDSILGDLGLKSPATTTASQIRTPLWAP